VRLVLAMVLAGLVALPLSVSAQDEDATSEPKLQEPAPSAEPATEEPALQLKLDSVGVGVVPSPLRTADGYTLEEMELRVRRAKIGYGVSAVVSGVGVGMGIAAGIGYYSSCAIAWEEPCYGPSWVAPVGWTGVALMSGGVVGMIASGILMRRRKRDRDSLRYAHYGTPRRVQWDLARSRLVF
jgi:hypothetical protein